MHPQGHIQAVSPRPSGTPKAACPPHPKSHPCSSGGHPLLRRTRVSRHGRAGQGKESKVSHMPVNGRAQSDCPVAKVSVSSVQVPHLHRRPHTLTRRQTTNSNTHLHPRPRQHQPHTHTEDVRNNNLQRPHPHHSLLPSRLRPAPLPALRIRLLPSPRTQQQPASRVFNLNIERHSGKPGRLGGSLEQSAGVPTGAKPAGRDADDVYQ
jgi:hypothetical protein